MSSNLKVNTILPSTGTAIGIGTAAGNIDILGHIVGHNTPNISGINSVTANHFYGDISNATGAAAGLGTALSQDQSNPLNKLYYTDRILSIGSTLTIDHPASATGAYTQYADILVEDNADLIVADGDDLIPDILGLGGNGTTGAGGAGRLLVDNIVNWSGTGAPTLPNGAVVTGVVTATSYQATTFQKTPTNTPAFFAYWNANNSMTIADSTDTKATWLTAEEYDTDNAYNTSTQTFTVPSGKGGYYTFNAGVQMYSNGNSLRTVIIRLRKNGSSSWVASNYSQVMNADENRMRHHQAHLHAVVNLAAGDTIELICWGRVLNNSLYISNDASGVKSNFLSGYKLIL